MADLFEVAEIIGKMADGFEEQVLKCLEANAGTAVQAIHEQLWGGLDGTDTLLNPNYDNDSFFEESDWWYHRNDDYKAWKMKITPPTSGWLLTIPPRPYNVPNLYIDGTFYSEIFARMNGDALAIYADGGDSADIVAKWGGSDVLLRLGGAATEYFSYSLIMPWIWNFFEQCGW